MLGKQQEITSTMLGKQQEIITIMLGKSIEMLTGDNNHQVRYALKC